MLSEFYNFPTTRPTSYYFHYTLPSKIRMTSSTNLYVIVPQKLFHHIRHVENAVLYVMRLEFVLINTRMHAQRVCMHAQAAPRQAAGDYRAGYFIYSLGMQDATECPLLIGCKCISCSLLIGQLVALPSLVAASENNGPLGQRVKWLM